MLPSWETKNEATTHLDVNTTVNKTSLYCAPSAAYELSDKTDS